MDALKPPTEIVACINCALFVYTNAQCGRARGAPDYVTGAPPKTMFAQTEREWDSETHCGPTARFFVPIVPADAYADAMIRRDMEARHTGRAENDRDLCGRQMLAGS